MITTIKRKEHVSILITVFLFLVVFFSNDTILFGTNANGAFVSLGFAVEGLLLVMLIIFALMKSQFQIVIIPRVVLTYAVMLSCVILSAVVNRDFRGGYITSVLMITIGCVFTEIIDIKSFVKVYVRLFELLAASSVLGLIVTSIIPALRTAGIKAENSRGVMFSHYIIYARSTQLTAGSRNYSIFREPGVFQAYLVIALLFAVILISKDKRIKKIDIIGIAVLIIAIVLTLSTTGYIGIALVALFYLSRNGVLRRTTRLAYALIALGILVLGLLLYFEFFASDVALENLYAIFISKFDRASNSYNSGISRIASIKTNISLWLLNPIFGVGITQKQELYSNIALSIFGYKPSDDTNTILAQFSLYGVTVGSIWVLAILGFSRKLATRYYEFLLIVLLLFILFMTEYLVFSTVCNILIWYGIRAFLLKDDISNKVSESLAK